MNKKSGILYICGTPIGNLEDISIRVLKVLKSVDFIVSEDTRYTKRLLNYFHINKPLISYFEYSSKRREEHIIDLLLGGKNLALVSCAGMPIISDPGAPLVGRAIEEGIEVVPLPGPTAFVLALVGSGIDARRFIFFGFLPKKGRERKNILEEISNSPYTSIIYESPYRTLKTLKELREYIGDHRRVALARELTKIHEEFIRGNIEEVINGLSKRKKIKGEITIVVEGLQNSEGGDSSMTEEKRYFYITTPIYYVNDSPHIGHAYTTIAADVMARFKRLSGYEVLFSTGTDEHGQKIEKTAKEKGMTPKELADSVVGRFKDLWKLLDIEYDDFIRTTEKRHEETVTYFFEKLKEKGAIYKGSYEGWYCVSCETYWPESQLVDGHCPDCGRKVERLQEESYFFRMSAYQDALLEHIEKHPDFIQPETRKNEIVSFVKQGLKDQSISRLKKNLSWGIPLPGDPDHVIYVWFDALINYLTILGYPKDSEKLEKFWPNAVHLIGKDILRFHAVIWPTMLIAAGLTPPKKVFAHGWWLSEGEKMSKSKGNVIDPVKVVKKYGKDPFRYFLLREVPFGQDGNFAEMLFVKRYNSDLVNDLGNLLNRTLPLVHRYREGIVPEPGEYTALEESLISLKEEVFANVEKFFDQLAFSQALEEIWRFVRATNKYMDEAAPWRVAKEGNEKRLDTILYTLLEAIRLISMLVYPVIPSSSLEMRYQLGLKGKWENGDMVNKGRWGYLRPGIRVKEPVPIFPRIDIKKMEKEKEKQKEKKEERMEYIDIDYFRKVDLRVAKILKAEDIEGADRLYKLTIKVGENEERTLVAGIKKYYKPEELVGKKIIIVYNLKPAKIRGVKSNGMLLAAKDGEVLALLTPEKDVKEGAKIS